MQNKSITEHQARRAADTSEQIIYELKKIIVGQDYFLQRLLVAILSQGHVLVEGAPGLAKTLTLKNLAKILGVSSSRIQFTADLLPSDILGTRIYNPATGEFSTELGPIFANCILADEINRAPSKVQSALLEAMEEKQITIGRNTYQLPQPFLVMATQNPIEQEGTYPLPEAQMDRFLLKLLVNYPNEREELVILERMTAEQINSLDSQLTEKELLKLISYCSLVYLDPLIMGYIVDIVQATRDSNNEAIEYGASPRGSLALAKSAKALALLKGRTYVLPEDVTELVLDCLRHRVIVSYEAIAEGLTTDAVLKEVVKKIPIPQLPEEKDSQVAA